MSPVKKEVAHRFSPPAAVPMSSLGNRGMMPTHMPRVKILQQQQQLIRQQNNRIFGWTIEDVFEFIRSIGLPDHANRFQEQVSITSTLSIFYSLRFDTDEKSNCWPRAMLSRFTIMHAKHNALEWFNCLTIRPFWAKSGKHYSENRAKLMQL